MKMSEERLFKFRLELEQIVTKREGMIAENKQREHLQQAMAYVEDDFDRINKQLRDLVDISAKCYECIMAKSNVKVAKKRTEIPINRMIRDFGMDEEQEGK